MRQVIDIMVAVGLPSIFAICVWFGKKVMDFGKRMDILMNAVQKQMRRELTQDYHKYMEQEYIDDDDLDLWMAGYNAYHELRQNGVMDSRKDDLIELNAHPRVKK